MIWLWVLLFLSPFLLYFICASLILLWRDRAEH